jgi:excinuclease ABC subunit B
LGVFDVLVGVNLLREGLDLPEVSLVAILDADKEGFLRNVKSLIQTIGRASRNVEGRVIMYADKITESMRIAIDETNRRRSFQAAYNELHGITPKTVFKSKEEILTQTKIADASSKSKKSYIEPETKSLAADPVVAYMSKDEISKMIGKTRKNMERSAKDLDFMEAARLRDELADLENLLGEL